MEIETVITGALEENCYILIKNNACLVVDPGDDYQLIKENIKDGVVIVSIEPNSPLGKVGIKQDAVLLELNGKKIIDKENFRNITRGVKHGDKYTIKYHQNGTTKKDKIII